MTLTYRHLDPMVRGSKIIGTAGGIILVVVGALLVGGDNTRFEHIFALFNIQAGVLGLASSWLVADRKIWILGQFGAALLPFLIGGLQLQGGWLGPFGSELWALRVAGATLLFVGGVMALLAKDIERAAGPGAAAKT